MHMHTASSPGVSRPIPPERRLRVAEVRKTQRITPHMQRITLASAAFIDFPVRRPAQWVKLFVPTTETEKPSGRAYTIREFREGLCEMDVDFVLHGDGPCSTWAEAARPGDVAQVAGPRAGFQPDPDLTHLLIGGDETALPAISSILEALPAGANADVFVEIPEDADAQLISTRADVEFTWLPRNGSEPGTATALAEAMMAASLPLENSFVWFAAEAGVVRRMRRHFLLDRGLERFRMAMAGYWKKGETDFRDREDTP